MSAIYALNVFELKWVNNSDIQLKEQINCIGYDFTIPDETKRLKNVRPMWQMTAVFGEGLTYSFPVPVILFSSVLL